MHCVSIRGERSVDAAAFFQDTYTPALEAGEILTDVVLPVPPLTSRSVYLKIQRRSGDFAIASVAVVLTLDADGRCERIGLALGGVDATPVLPAEVAEFLRGKVLSEEVIAEAGAMLGKRLHPIEDVRGSADYKRRIACVAFARALRGAIAGPNHAAGNA
jgi:carbon-monoxide dehydrogenase medium subunit